MYYVCIEHYRQKHPNQTRWIYRFDRCSSDCYLTYEQASILVNRQYDNDVRSLMNVRDVILSERLHVLRRSNENEIDWNRFSSLIDRNDDV
jgi:hypothetical protein